MHDLQSFPKEKNVPGQKPMDKEIFDTDGFSLNLGWNGILFPKLFDLLWEKIVLVIEKNFGKKIWDL